MITYWRTCLFKGIGSKRQSYIDLLTNEMVRRGFKQKETIMFEKDNFSEVGIEHILLDIGTFENPDGKFNIGFQIFPSNENLQVGFTLSRKLDIRFFAFLILSLLVTAMLYYMIKYALPYVNEYSLRLLLIVIFFLAALVLPYSRLSIIKWNRQLMQILIEIAESMGSKQITPFKRTTKIQG